MGTGGAGSSDKPTMDGTWEITAAIDDGEVVSLQQIREKMAQQGRLTISGQQITFQRPTGEKRTLLFVANSQTSPASLDLGGADKTSGKGIFLIGGDTLMICLSGPGIESRPTEFSSKPGSHALLMTLKRVKKEAAVPPPPPAVAVEKKVPTEDNLRRLLIGTWGSQDANKIEYWTFNPDGTFSSTCQWKKALHKMFHEEARVSGTWKAKDGVMVMTITASAARELVGQVYSLRLNSINPTEVIYITQDGSVRRQWKVR
jgi:uncharacterized protein (TIGR03067 family)